MLDGLNALSKKIKEEDSPPTEVKKPSAVDHSAQLVGKKRPRESSTPAPAASVEPRGPSPVPSAPVPRRPSPVPAAVPMVAVTPIQEEDASFPLRFVVLFFSVLCSHQSLRSCLFLFLFFRRERYAAAGFTDELRFRQCRLEAYASLCFLIR